jgi:hypothetical protein
MEGHTMLGILIDHETQIGLKLLAERTEPKERLLRERDNEAYVKRLTDIWIETGYRWLMGARRETLDAAVNRRIGEIY